jgi:hypothetical protein
MKPGDLVICGEDHIRARVVRVSSAPRRSSDSELIPRHATIVTCEMPWGAHWDYWADNLELIEPEPPGTNDTGGLMQVGDVVRHAPSGLRGRIESVTVRTRETAVGTETYRVFFVAIEPGQHRVWWDSEIDA